MRITNVAKAYKPRFVAMKKKTVREFVILHKRKVRHAAKQYLKTGNQRDYDRMAQKLTNWDFD
jgi:hypothetical protein